MREAEGEKQSRVAEGESRRWKRGGSGSLIGTEGRGLSFPEG